MKQSLKQTKPRHQNYHLHKRTVWYSFHPDFVTNQNNKMVDWSMTLICVFACQPHTKGSRRRYRWKAMSNIVKFCQLSTNTRILRFTEKWAWKLITAGDGYQWCRPIMQIRTWLFRVHWVQMEVRLFGITMNARDFRARLAMFTEKQRDMDYTEEWNPSSNTRDLIPVWLLFYFFLVKSRMVRSIGKSSQQ